jgi:hypothetical protein
MLFQINIRQIRQGKDYNLTGNNNFEVHRKGKIQNFPSDRGKKWKNLGVIGKPG